MQQGELSTKALLDVTGYERVGDLRRSLDNQRIPYFLGKGGAPWTTIDLVNAAKGLQTNTSPQPIGAEIL
jgi:hypothetical protein